MEIESLLAKVDLVQLIRDEGYEPSRDGTNRLKMVCPFHDDRGPSLKIFASTATWKCFGCDTGGTALDFVMNQHKVGVKDAIVYLVGKYAPEYSLETLQQILIQLTSAVAEKDAKVLSGELPTSLRVHLRHQILDHFRPAGIEIVIAKQQELSDFLLHNPDSASLSSFMEKVLQG